MENQGELMLNQSNLMNDRLGLFYSYFRDEAAIVKDVIFDRIYKHRLPQVQWQELQIIQRKRINYI